MWGMEGISWQIQEVKRLWLIPLAFILAFWGPTSVELANEKLKPNKITAAIVGVLLVYIILEVGKGQVNEFIYFQF